jgi:hypothetical protein
MVFNTARCKPRMKEGDTISRVITGFVSSVGESYRQFGLFSVPSPVVAAHAERSASPAASVARTAMNELLCLALTRKATFQ